MNYLGYDLVGNNGYFIVPANTSNLVAVYDCPISGTLVTPTVNGTALTNKFSFTSWTGVFPSGVPGRVAEMYPAPPAGTYLNLSDWNVTYFFFSGAGSVRSVGTAGSASITGLQVVSVNVPSTSDEYIVGMAAGSGTFPSTLSIDGGSFYTITNLGGKRIGAHQSNGTLADVDITMGSGGAGGLYFGFTSVTSTTTSDNSGGIIAIM